MEEKKITEKVIAHFPDACFDLTDKNTEHLVLTVPAEMLPAVCEFLKEDNDLNFETLTCLSGVDNGEVLTSVYHLFSYRHKHFCVLKVNVPKSSPEIPTMERVWPGAGWFEREAYDLLGIIYQGHSDLRRIMLPEDWFGHPLRKDYVEKEEYRGMGTTRNDPLDAEE